MAVPRVYQLSQKDYQSAPVLWRWFMPTKVSGTVWIKTICRLERDGRCAVNKLPTPRRVADGTIFCIARRMVFATSLSFCLAKKKRKYFADVETLDLRPLNYVYVYVTVSYWNFYRPLYSILLTRDFIYYPNLLIWSVSCHEGQSFQFCLFDLFSAKDRVFNCLFDLFSAKKDKVFNSSCILQFCTSNRIQRIEIVSNAVIWSSKTIPKKCSKNQGKARSSNDRLRTHCLTIWKHMGANCIALWR